MKIDNITWIDNGDFTNLQARQKSMKIDNVTKIDIGDLKHCKHSTYLHKMNDQLTKQKQQNKNQVHIHTNKHVVEGSCAHLHKHNEQWQGELSLQKTQSSLSK
jgi:hypothetical protein